MTARLRPLTGALAIAAALAACAGGSDPGSAPAPEAAADGADAGDAAASGTGDGADERAGDTAGAAATVGTSETDLGTILVDGQGRTLYLFDDDPDGESVCVDGCAETWPPLPGPAEAAGEADDALLGTATRDDGQTQATYADRPLYHYAPDEAPGDVTGQGVGGVWWVVGPDGAAIGDDGAEDDAGGSGASSPGY